jgi:hypothetical protein
MATGDAPMRPIAETLILAGGGNQASAVVGDVSVEIPLLTPKTTLSVFVMQALPGHNPAADTFPSVET